ncbi:MAG TPA: aminoglycoside phosphotransferase family protein [Propionibacteriaceae bacterium]
MGRDVGLAVRIAARLGLPVEPVVELTGAGSVNRAFVVGAGDERAVVRFAIDPLRADEFVSETWCLRLAARHGIPTPEALAFGVLDGVPYGVQRFVPGVGGTRAPTPGLWRTLGRYARTINELPLTADAPAGLYSRFGRDLPDAWRAHLGYHLSQLNSEDPLLRLGVYPVRDQPRLREMVLRLADTPMAFGLSHGDLALRNVLIRDDGQVVLLDWGSASCGPVPYVDLLVLLRDHERQVGATSAHLDDFASGYGLDLAELAPTLSLVQQLTALDTLRWALQHRPDRVPELVSVARQVLRAEPPARSPRVS